MIKRNRFEIVGRSLVFAAGVIVSVVFVSIMILEFENSKQLSDAVNENMIGLTSAVRDSGVMMYDGVRVLGADVLNFGKKYFYSASGGEEFVMTITLASGQELSVSSRNDMEEVVRSSGLGISTETVNPLGEYIGKVTKNDNGVITLVSFASTDYK